MTRPCRKSRQAIRLSRAGILVLGGALATMAGLARGGDGAPPARERPASGTADDPKAEGPPAQEAIAELHYKGKPTPGSRITVGLGGPEEPGTSYRWVQVEGPAVEVENPTGSKIHLTVPANASRLGFLLTVRDGQGRARQARIIIPIQAGPEANTKPGPSGPRADGGDDQIGLVARRITLDGSRSTPGEGLRFRWFQMEGPKVEQASQNGAYYSFVPTAPGRYRFGLIVADGQDMSEPDEVTVEVGEMSGTGGPGAFGALDRTGASGLSSLLLGRRAGPDGSTLTDRIADALESIAGRADLYSSFDDLSSELTRRLDAVIPSEPRVRQLWSEVIFAPLSQYTAQELLGVGLDIRFPQARQQALTAAQKARLQALFRGYAREFRAQDGTR